MTIWYLIKEIYYYYYYYVYLCVHLLFFPICRGLDGIWVFVPLVFSGAIPKQEEASRAAATCAGAVCATDCV